METLVMSGRPVADAYKEQIKEKVEAAQKSGKKVTLAILTVGQDPASFVYRKRLLKITESLGIGSRCVELPETATTEETVAAIRKLNEDPDVTGILPMMPMPKQVDGDAVGAALAPEKDMDCLNPANGGALLMGKGRWAACTPRACMAMLKFYKIPLDGKHAVVLGRSNVVGKPVALLLLQENCTVTVCHSHTKNLPELVRQADIVVAAIGKAGFVTPDMVKPGAVIVDVGINVTETGIVGDVAPEATEKASAFTPVPGGVGLEVALQGNPSPTSSLRTLTLFALLGVVKLGPSWVAQSTLNEIKQSLLMFCLCLPRRCYLTYKKFYIPIIIPPPCPWWRPWPQPKPMPIPIGQPPEVRFSSRATSFSSMTVKSRVLLVM